MTHYAMISWVRLKEVDTMGVPNLGGRTSVSPLFKSLQEKASWFISSMSTHYGTEDSEVLTLKLCSRDTVPECQTTVAATRAESSLHLVESERVDSENILGAADGGSSRHATSRDVVSMTFEREISPVVIISLSQCVIHYQLTYHPLQGIFTYKEISFSPEYTTKSLTG